VKESLLTSTSTLLGGNLGLFLGFSCLSVAIAMLNATKKYFTSKSSD
jgi:hypothetical protein